MSRNEFDYVNKYYGLNIMKHSPVINIRTAKRGQVAKGDGQYIWIQWDGAARPQGPYHPTDELKYP